MLPRNGITNARALSEYFSRVFSPCYGERPTINYDNISLSMNPLIIERGTALRLLQRLKHDKFGGPDDIHPRVMKGLPDVIAEPLDILLETSLWQLRLPRDQKDTTTSSVYKSGGRDLVCNY